MYKVGEKVRVLETITRAERTEAVYMTNELYNTRGMVGEITDINQDLNVYALDFGNRNIKRWYAPEWVGAAFIDNRSL